MKMKKIKFTKQIIGKLLIHGQSKTEKIILKNIANMKKIILLSMGFKKLEKWKWQEFMVSL